MPFIAEDLGIVTPAVRALVAEIGIPGMDVVQFADEDVHKTYHPKPNKVVYTSTHDTSTLLGWCMHSFGPESASQSCSHICTEALCSSAPVVMVSLQDVLGLDDKARMNTPGVAEGNWKWSATEEQLSGSFEKLKNLAKRCGRFSPASPLKDS
jgi:4-alpha-glucanotransferase